MKVTYHMTADAVQWTGTPESLKEIQQLLAPGSPLYKTSGDGTEALGVYVPKGGKFNSIELQFADPESWIVRDGDQIAIYTQEAFQTRFASAASGDPTNWSTCQPIVATHPRAIDQVGNQTS